MPVFIILDCSLSMISYFKEELNFLQCCKKMIRDVMLGQTDFPEISLILCGERYQDSCTVAEKVNITSNLKNITCLGKLSLDAIVIFIHTLLKSNLYEDFVNIFFFTDGLTYNLSGASSQLKPLRLLKENAGNFVLINYFNPTNVMSYFQTVALSLNLKFLHISLESHVKFLQQKILEVLSLTSNIQVKLGSDKNKFLTFPALPAQDEHSDLEINSVFDVSVLQAPIMSRSLMFWRKEVTDPHLAAMLHGTIKINNICLSANIAKCFGIISSLSDSKRKNCLLYCILKKCASPFMELSSPNAYLFKGRKSICQKKASYLAYPAIWTSNASIVTDLHKMIRHSRKLPEKEFQLTKEIQKLKQKCLSLGFPNLLLAISYVLKNEQTTNFENKKIRAINNILKHSFPNSIINN